VKNVPRRDVQLASLISNLTTIKSVFKPANKTNTGGPIILASTVDPIAFLVPKKGV
jgi:hypothetical protein